MSPSRPLLRELGFVFLALVLPVKAGFAQQTSNAKPYIAIELQPADPEIKALLESARTDSDLGNYEVAFSKTKNALELAETKGFVGDKAIAEEAVAVGYFASGQLDESFRFYQSSLQDAVDSSNLVLQADVLVSLAMLPQLQGKLQAASDLLTKAQQTADQSKNPYVRSRVLGELGRLEIASGKSEQGLQSLEEALSIDRVNHYDFEPLHMVYATTAMLSQPKPDFAKAISQLESARDLAIEKGNYIAFVLSQNVLGAIYPNTGEPQKGIAMLEATLNGNVLKDGQTKALPEAFHSAAALPFAKAILLEGLGRAYQVGQQPDKALEAWGQLYSLSVNVGLKLTQAEAARAIAEIYKGKQDIPNALNYFSIATQTWRTLQNDQQLSDTLISEALFLTKSEKGEQAIPLETEVAEIAARTQKRPLLFTANMVLAEIYRPPRFNEARAVLEKAQSLIRPGPGDSEIDNKLVIETYGLLADVYKALGLPIKELVSLEKGIAVLQILKDDEHLQQTVSYMRGRVQALQVQERATKAAADGQLVESLWYSEILYVWNGVASDPSKDDNWNRVLNLPYKIVQQRDGPQALDEIFSEMGPLLSVARLDILGALSDYFTRTDYSKPELAERYASEAEAAVKQMPNPSNVLLVRPVCQLTIAYAWQNKTELAKQKATECTTLAADVTDPALKNLANVANALAQVASNNQGDAVSSLEFFLKNRPDQPELHLQMAFALIKQGLYEKGIAEFNLAVKLIENTNDLNAEANAFARMALALAPLTTTEALALAPLTSTESKRQQLDYLKSAERLYKQINNFGLTATVEMQIGMYYVNAGDTKSALAYLQETQAVSEQSHDAQVSAAAESEIGIVYAGMRDYAKAIEFQKRAAATYHELGNKPQEAMSLVFLAEDLEAEGNLQDALRTCQTAEALAKESAANLAEYWANRTLGNIYDTQGDFETAAAALKNAVDTAKRAGQQQNEANAELTLAFPYEVVGQWDDALGVVEKALETFHSIGDKQGEASADGALAEIYGFRTSSIRDLDKAVAYLADAKQLGYSQDVDATEIFLQTGRYSNGIDAAKNALDKCARHDEQCQAHALMSLSEVQRENGDIVNSASSLKDARRLAANSTDFYLQGRLLYVEAGQQRAEGHLQQAVDSYERVISLLESVKGQGDLKTERLVAESYGFIYDELTSTIYALSANKASDDKAKFASQALEYTETNKAREFSESWGRTFINELRHQLPAGLQEEERSLIAKRDQLEAKLAGDVPHNEGNSEETEQQLKTDLSSVQKELDNFVAGLRRNQSQYATVAYPEPVALASLPLSKGETLFEFRVTDESTFVWVLRNTSGTKTELVAFYQVPKSRQWLSERVNKIHDALGRTQGKVEDWHRISEELFGQLFPGELSKVLLGSPKLVFVPDDILFLIPFELLSPEASKGTFPLLGAATTYYPSAAALRLARAVVHSATWQEAFLGIADPITSPNDKRYDSAAALERANPAPAVSAKLESFVPTDIDKITSRGYRFPPLPHTKDEIEHIAALFQEKGQIIEARSGFTATKSQLLDTDLTKFRFLHFATHGILAVDSNIREPALVLSYDGSEQHMFLSMSEIVALKIRAEMVVLSACDTGNGKVSRAEGVMSLGRAFMTAGAESVTVSLWEVSDESTQILMEEYYKNLIAGKSKAEALARARSFLFANGFTNPYDWAPFVLIGD